MKVPLLLTSILLCTCCAQKNQTSSSNGNASLAAQKITFSLPDEDLVLLKIHNPDLLKKLQQSSPLTIDDVISLQQLGFTSDLLIRAIHYTGSQFELSTSDVLKLQAEGVPFKVINYMIRS